MFRLGGAVFFDVGRAWYADDAPEWIPADRRGEAFDHALVGEPTNPNALGDMIKIGRRGSLSGTVTITGKQGHSAYPHLAKNPMRGLAKVMHALLDEPLEGLAPIVVEEPG